MNENFKALISALTESATDLQYKKNDFATKSTIVNNQKQQIMGEYNEKLLTAKQHFEATKAYILRNRDADINLIDTTQADSAEEVADSAQQSFESIASEAKKSFNINNEQMSQILSNQTGIEWKSLKVTGHPVYCAQSGNSPLYPYGVVFVNQNDNNFENSVYDLENSDFTLPQVTETESFYPVILGASSDDKYEQQKADNFNWGHLYLYAKARETQEAVNQEATNQNNEEFVISQQDSAYSAFDYNVTSVYSGNPNFVKLLTNAIDNEYQLCDNQATGIQPSLTE